MYSHKRRQILREVIMIHLLPVAINFTLLGLYIEQVLWTPPWPTTNISNALQFAAKLHETLMIASLVSVLLHHIRYKLLSSDGYGLPLGLITSPFRLLDISYLWSRDFSAACRSVKGFRLSEFITIIIHLFLFILAAVVGPASAISVLPRLGEWQVAKTIIETPFFSTQHRNNSYHVYMAGELSDIFPKRITASFNPGTCDYSRPSQPHTNTCPRSGLTDIIKGLFPPDNRSRGGEHPRLDFVFSYNITVQALTQTMLPARIMKVQPGTVTPPFGQYYKTTFEATADVTTPTDAILFLAQTLPGYYLQNWGQLGKANTSSRSGTLSREEWSAKFTLYPGLPHSRDSSSFWKQPHVSCFCSRTRHDETSSEPVTFNFIQSGPIGSTPPYNVTVDAGRLFRALSDTGMGFIDSSDLSITPNYRPSAAFAFASHSLTTLCLVKARWIDFSLSGSFSQSFDRELHESMQNLNWSSQPIESSYILMSRVESGWFNKADAGDLIQLDLDWLNVLDRGTGIGANGKYSFFGGVRKVCLVASALDIDNHTEEHPDITCMACGLGAGIAEGLSKVPYKSGIHAVLSMKDTSPGKYTSTLSWSRWLKFPTVHLSTDFGLPGDWNNSTLAPAQIMANSTRLDFIVTQKLHGYSFSGITITLAFVVLFLYVATVLVHISIMTFGTSWSSRAWKSLGEFYVLALQSPIPTSVLDNTGGGVKVSRTWQARASVKEWRDGNRVGVVVREPSQPGAEDGSISKVRPDWKYS